MSNPNENGHELADSQPENGTNANKDMQQKKKPLTAFVQIEVHGPVNGQEVELSQNCSTVAEHAAFLQGRINKTRGSVVGLRLNVPVETSVVLKGTVALMDDKMPLEADCKYTFRFKLADVQEKEEDQPDPVEDLPKPTAQLAGEKWTTDKSFHLFMFIGLFFLILAVVIVLVMVNAKKSPKMEEEKVDQEYSFPIQMVTVVQNDALPMDYNITLEEESKHTSKFKLDNGRQLEEDNNEKDGPEPIEELAKPAGTLFQLFVVSLILIMAMAIAIVIVEAELKLEEEQRIPQNDGRVDNALKNVGQSARDLFKQNVREN